MIGPHRLSVRATSQGAFVMRVKVLLFAVAREKAGASTLELELPPDARVLELKTGIARACPALAPYLPGFRVAINSSYSVDDLEPIPPDAELALIPPVSGGATRGGARP